MFLFFSSTELRIYLIALITIILLLIILIVTRLIKNKLKREISIMSKSIPYLRSVKRLKQLKEVGEMLKKLNQMAKNFFVEYFRVSSSLTYSEIGKIAQKKGMHDIADFCEEISILNYSGKSIDIEDVRDLVKKFEDIIIRYKNKELIRYLERKKRKKVKKEKRKNLKGNEGTSKKSVKAKEINKDKKIRIISALIKEGKIHLKKGDINEAYASYNAIKKIYSRLNKHDRKKCKKRIVDFYNEIKKKIDKKK